jgi:antitoxin (DNA-binding transcriptional repressor) of toxin-antitoxin stability system
MAKDHSGPEICHEENRSRLLQDNCLAVTDEVQAKRETVVITKRGKPVAKLVPVNTETDEIYNFLVGKGAVAGEIVSPALSREEWGELK